MYNEDKGKIIIKERVVEGVAARQVQVARMTESNLMRPTLDFNAVMRHSLPSLFPRIYVALHAHLTMSLPHIRLDRSGQGALHRLIRSIRPLSRMSPPAGLLFPPRFCVTSLAANCFCLLEARSGADNAAGLCVGCSVQSWAMACLLMPR